MSPHRLHTQGLQMNSMTGFGHGTCSRPPHTVDVQISSYNRKQLDTRVKMSRGFESIEKDVRALVDGAVARGAVFVNVALATDGTGAAEVAVDTELARRVHTAAESVAAELGLSGQLTIHDLLQVPDLFVVRPPELDEATARDMVSEAVKPALKELAEMRATEGAAMLTDLRARCVGLQEMMQRVRTIGPATVERYRAKLLERVGELINGIEHDDERLHREVVVFADRCDITEELTRLDSHLEQMQTLFAATEPVGRKLDFMIQEMVREINTVGSKSQDVEIARIVVDFKTELDRIREQIQNVE